MREEEVDAADETAGDVDGWTKEPADPDVVGPAAEFVDQPLIDRPEPADGH